MGKEKNTAIAPVSQREPLGSLVLYKALKWTIVQPILSSYFRSRVIGLENVPTTGGFIAVSNHASNFDPPILAAAVGRPVAFMAKEELFRVPILKQIIRIYGAYPVKRGAGDRAAIRAALASLQEGWGVGIFLQGTRTADGRVTKPKSGAVLIATKAQVPLIPISLIGTEKILKGKNPFPHPTALTIRIGEAIAPPKTVTKEALTQTTETCAHQINALHALGR
ncbi:lysophospholipid acyltransferase family protein [[Limnothrix rosea] IAM M-220]|uniref:lysophospholipid acyltransferase family protein n=1 Tax=[Limnothrix rosea] IAM M-220 TaxID=454133 RepID=UPI000964CB1C|nr:lysophospholipid acyltransferase family protein [[Limnothrix rosea] IAM M-220]OKH11520.1 1-acyl-sn-glycerol-3-phosphate acyltransferase [[Limnothrix rosea] IAM M-220]